MHHTTLIESGDELIPIADLVIRGRAHNQPSLRVDADALLQCQLPRHRVEERGCRHDVDSPDSTSRMRRRDHR
jgi:hypothetical protein